MSILIKNGRVVTPDGIFEKDIFIDGETIGEIKENIKAQKDDHVIDAQGKLIFPGFIDTHTHLDMDTGKTRTADNFSTGTRAAIAGGTTTVLDFATQEHGDSLNNALVKWHELAREKSACDYGFHMAITYWNEEIKAELPLLTREGVTSYKLYMAYDNLRVTDATIYEILKAVKEQNGIVGVHCENGDLVNELTRELLSQGMTGPNAHPLSRPDIVEAEAISRFLSIAKIAGAPVNIVHLSTKKGLQVIKNARETGQPIYVETCPQYLLLTDEKYEQKDFEGAKYVISPPLRREKDNDALWNAIQSGKIDTVGSDHCPFKFEQKKLGLNNFSQIPNGAPGVDVRAQLLYTYGVTKGLIDEVSFVKLICGNAAKLFGMYPKKGTLQPGSDADIVIWDPNYEGVITDTNQHTCADYTPFNGMSVTGRPAYVLLRGTIVAQDGEPFEQYSGQYVYRGPCQFWRD